MKKIYNIILTLSLLALSSFSYAEIININNMFKGHNHMPADVLYKSIEDFYNSKDINRYFINKKISQKFTIYFNNVSDHNFNNFNETRTITYQTKNKTIKIGFILKKNRWFPKFILLNNKEIKNNRTTKELTQGLSKSEDGNYFPSFIKKWEKNNPNEKIKSITNAETVIENLYSTINNKSNKLTYYFKYIPHGKNNGWKISNFQAKENSVQQKGNTSYQEARSYDIANYINESDYTSPEAHFSDSENGLIVQNKVSMPSVNRITCDFKKMERKIRLAFVLNNSETVEHHLDSYDAHRSFMRLRLNGVGATIDPNNCKNLKIINDSNGRFIDISLSGFGVPIKGFKYGYGKVAGRSYIDFKY